MSMSGVDELRADRERKRDMLKEAGMNPYPAETARTHSLKQVLEGFELLQESDETFVVAGRVMSIREHGAIAFVDLYDGTEKMQIFFSKETVPEDLFNLLVSAINTGDFIEVSGTAFVTKRGMNAVGARSWRVLTKALATIPTEHFGLKDDDDRLRKRYLEILLDNDVREMFKKKAAFWRASRRFLEDKVFEEVHTPTLETTTGGAEANPFVTHHDDYDMDVFLRISVGELWQKRLMAAGIPRVFEVGRVYRNEGSSPDHLQEFTNIEFYAAYMSFDEGLQLLEDHIHYVLDEAFAGQRVFTIKGFEVDFSGPFKRIDYVETIEKETGINVVTASYEEIAEKVAELKIEHEGANRERLTDTLWKYCRKKISGPVWLTGHPKLVSPLSKESDKGDGTVLRAQLIMAGAEFNNCFAELNDPDEQKERFEAQAELLAQGDDEAMMPDWEFVEMLEYGMPPTFGAATLGERFFAYLVDKPIRETQYFPLMKPQQEVVKKEKTEPNVAVVVVNKGANMEGWQEQNTVAHLAAQLGVRGGSELLKFNSIKTEDGYELPMNIQHAILIKESDDTASLRTLHQEAKKVGLHDAVFTREMLETTNDNKVRDNTAAKQINDVEYLGVLVFGSKSEVDAVTGDFILKS